MNLLAVSDDVSALVVGGGILFASMCVAYLAFQKGANGKQSLETDAVVVLKVDQRREKELPVKHAA